MSYIPNIQSLTSQIGVNSYTATTGSLWTGNVFVGAGEQNDFNYVGVNLQTDESGTLTFEFSQNGTNWSSYPTQEFTIAAGINEVHGAWKGTRYVRPKFTGVDGSRTYFRIRTMYSYAPIALSAPLNQPIGEDSDATIVKSIIAGQKFNNRFSNSPVDNEGHIFVHIHDPKTAFGEIRMSEMTPQIQTSFVYGINQSLIVTGSTGSGSVSSSNSMIVVETGAASSSSAEISTIRPLKYNPGQGSLARFTGVFTSGVTGNTQWIGPLDDEDGFAFGYSGNTFGVLRRQNSVDFFTPQSSWSDDVMDGSLSNSNPSAQLLDPTKGNVFEIKFQYLGFGNIVYSIERSESGEFVPVHLDKYANNYVVPSVFNPTLPIKVITENTTNTSNVVLQCASISGFVEGKRELTGPIRAFSNAKNPATSEHTFSIRNKSTFKGKNNKVRIYIQLINASSRAVGGSGDPVSLSIIKNPTFGSVLTWVDVNTDSVVETSITDSTVTNGETILNLSLASSDSTNFSPPDKFIYEIAPNDIVTFKATGTNPGFSAGITWVEDF